MGGLLSNYPAFPGFFDSWKGIERQKKMANASALRSAGRFAEAKIAFEEALGLAKEENNRAGQIFCLMNIGVLSWNLGEVGESVHFYRKALLLAKELRLIDKQEECAAAIKIYDLYSRAKTLRDENRHEESVQSFKQAIDLARKIHSLEHELKCLRQLSLNFPEEHEQFFQLNSTALEIAKKIKHRLEEARCLNNIGLFYWKSNKYSTALGLLNEALLIAREIDRGGKDESACLNNLGIVYRELGDYDRALRHLKEALEIDRTLNDYNNIANDLNNIGEVIRNKDDKQHNLEAYAYYEMCIDIASKIKNQNLQIFALNNMGLFYQEHSKFFKSIECLTEAYRKSKKNPKDKELSHIFSNLGTAYFGLRDLEKAKDYYNKALELALSAGRDEVLWEAYFGLGRCMEYEQQYKLGLSYYRMAVEVIDSIKSGLAVDLHKAGFFRNKLKVYESYLNLLFKLITEEKAGRHDNVFFQTVERAKARTFIEELRDSKLDEQEMDRGAYKKLGEISKKISRTLSELANEALPEQTRQAIWERLEDEEEQYIICRTQMKAERKRASEIDNFGVVSLEYVQRDILDQGTAIMEFFLGTDQSYAFLITKKDFVLKKFPGRSAIEDSLKAYLRMISMPSQGEFKGVLAAKRIYRDLVLPFQEYLSPSINRLIIIPDGILYYLPFETLVADLGGGAKGSGYLIEFYKISYAPSVSSLVFLMQRGNAKRNPKYLLALGNPNYSLRNSKDQSGNNFKKYEELLREFYLNKGFNFSSLPFSKKEIKKISNFFPKNKIDIFTEGKAKEEVVKKVPLSDYQILHFACHAFLDEKTPYRSALILNLDDDTEEDGFLQVREIQDLKLNANLAVLSACQTGRGRLENGEGVFGLPRAFFYAGALSTISSLWKVSDRVTSDFMHYFYHFLAQGNDKSQALRLAKIKMLKSRFSHPFFWAGFVLNGDYQAQIILH